ncbi:hypothetical protein HDU92_002073 [Lobulomyces angularis]|nr:hypothetical protein HDU92_002073 [Lobulomyces angularis]
MDSTSNKRYNRMKSATQIRTSDTHPINITFIPISQNSGSITMSSMPGKKVRLDTGAVKGRAAVNRDINSDFKRLSENGVKTIVCCLDDYELNFMGVPTHVYMESAKKFNFNVIRLPIVEGSCPQTVQELDIVLNEIEKTLKNLENVLVHCRGGIGRAGLVVCCYLLKSKTCSSTSQSIKLVRSLRSPKAIETKRQEDYIRLYEIFLNSNAAFSDAIETSENELLTSEVACESVNDIEIEESLLP